MHRVGIDLGGTKIEGIMLAPDGKEIFRRRIETRQEKGYDSILQQLRTLYETLLPSINGKPHTLGIGTPGSLSSNGLLKNSNTVCLNGKPLLSDLKKILGRNLKIENDANCFAIAEALQGAGQGHKMVFGVIMGTGCGGGIVYEQKIWNGHMGIAGEWGHMSIDPHGPDCYCGSRGCIETFISGGGLEKRFEHDYGKKLTLQEIAEKYRRGEEKASVFMETFFCHFGRALANLINVLDPDIIVLGGGVSNLDELYVQGVRAVQACVFNDRFDTPVVKNKLGDSAGVIGAAWAGTA